MFPGMMTGSSTAVGAHHRRHGRVDAVGLGLPRERAAAFVAMGSVLGMVAPPVNIPAMLDRRRHRSALRRLRRRRSPCCAFPLALRARLRLWAGRCSTPLAGPGVVCRQCWAARQLPEAVRQDAPTSSPCGGRWLPIFVAAALMLGPAAWPRARARPRAAVGLRVSAPRWPLPIGRVRRRRTLARPSRRRCPCWASSRAWALHPGDDADGRARVAGVADAGGAVVGHRAGRGGQHAAVRRRLRVRVGIRARRPVPARVPRPQRGRDDGRRCRCWRAWAT